MEKLEERKFDKRLVEITILTAEKVVNGMFGRKIAQSTVGEKLLRVVFEEQKAEGAFLIITAYFAKKERYI